MERRSPARNPGAHWIIGVGAMAAMLGVLLNLLLGLFRMAMALGRRRDLPGFLPI